MGSAFAGALAAAMLCGSAGTAAAAPAGCTAADLARVSASVATDTETYLTAHSDVNEFFTSLKTMPAEQVQSSVESYMDSHPQVHDDLKKIRQPRNDLQKRCNWSSDELPD
ncbi:conserved hypothetical protein [Mycolicibacter sinensis]|uniref:Haemophore haem-binding domain-containing protein n=1 Tax=Mycolicibacter sinensis (strain JDM601) TaxID=875328 RepID=F5YRZ5_MYCSD|nr:heme-binding protein [Mycolicibacter sinensis]AEF34777.1 conserved hypothetical protein [Mycolicibacter sinensis]